MTHHPDTHTAPSPSYAMAAAKDKDKNVRALRSYLTANLFIAVEDHDSVKYQLLTDYIAGLDELSWRNRSVGN